MFDKIIPITRRLGCRDFLSIGAAAAAVVAGIKAPLSVAATVNTVPASSPVHKVIAEYQAAAKAHDKAMSAAERALFEAFPDPMKRPQEGDEHPAHIQRLYDEAERRYWIMNAAYDRVVGTPCTSLGDCISFLEWGGDGDVETVIDAVLPCLRRLAGAA